MQQYLIKTSAFLRSIDSSLPPREQMKQFTDLNKETLSLLTGAEREAVLKYFFPADAAMSCVSALVKRLVIAECVGIPFSEVVVSRGGVHGKPVYLPAAGRGEVGKEKGVAFNVSHQAGLVALIAIAQEEREGEEYEVGIDVVCVNERGELERILEAEDMRGAFNGFVDMHAEVFSPKEIAALKLSLPLLGLRGGGGAGEAEEGKREREREREEMERSIRKGMRRFYALWCCREAYVKMTGEALLAEWLRELEFRRWPVPEPEAVCEEAGGNRGEGQLGEGESGDGENVGIGEGEMGFDIYFRGERVTGTEMRILSVGERFLVASAVRRTDGKGVDVERPRLEEVGVEEVVRRCREAR